MVSRRKSKIGELASHALISDEDVLWLQIPMIDSNRMAVLHGIQDLEEGSLDQILVANVLALLGDVREQVTFWTVLHYNIGAIRSIHDLDEGDYVWVRTRLVVELDFSLLELPLTGLKPDLVECLHGIGNIGLDVHGCVDDSISSNSEDASQLKSSSKNLA